MILYKKNYLWNWEKVYINIFMFYLQHIFWNSFLCKIWSCLHTTARLAVSISVPDATVILPSMSLLLLFFLSALPWTPQNNPSLFQIYLPDLQGQHRLNQGSPQNLSPALSPFGLLSSAVVMPLNFSVHRNALERLSMLLSPHLWRFWLSRTKVGPQSLHF